MREIKFRAWDKRNGKMITKFSLSHVSTGKFHLFPDEWPTEKAADALKEMQDPTGYYGLIDYSNYYFEDCEIMQYTGIKDKNGKDIYEGDIIKMWHEEMFFEGNVTGVIEWSDSCAAFSIEHESSGQFICGIDTDYAEIEIIGNVYENKELLEK